ncbi:MAG: hypothetical protein Q8934_14390 [Bacillota bacterium]|nr:hypothetical protein [Bacillota bacterium]
MNVDLINFYGAKNVEFDEFTYVEEFGTELSVFTLTDIPADEWNRKACIQNTKMFVETFNREPKDLDEVYDWIYSFLPKGVKDHRQEENQPTANELAFA